MTGENAEEIKLLSDLLGNIGSVIQGISAWGEISNGNDVIMRESRDMIVIINRKLRILLDTKVETKK